MHVDRIATHVISTIVHIAHSYKSGSADEEPWPLLIQDNMGVWHNVTLEEGQMVQYESAVCVHGRPTPLVGDYYASVFVHYRPREQSVWGYTEDDIVLRVPPHWSAGLSKYEGEGGTQ
ncbi:hypothetical protein B484DRAFT_409365 [Ochromonadaceae sp. CCMP2298]|nr:hypothetical protein B484DRAFT_409365 [Ochromonadaceae sp. CCMP2298]